MANLLYTASHSEAMEGTAPQICMLKLKTKSNLALKKRDQLSLTRFYAHLAKIEMWSSLRVRFNPLSLIESRKQSLKTSKSQISVSVAQVALRSV